MVFVLGHEVSVFVGKLTRRAIPNRDIFYSGYAYVSMGDNTCGLLNDMTQVYME